nr:protein cngc15a [Quercus suber]
MDGRMLDAICERLKPCPYSCTTNGGRSGFFNSCSIGAGDFCGEELLTWALDPRPNVVLPSSTRTVKAITEVEAFALIAEDSHAAKLAASTRRGGSKRCGTQFDILNSLQKPVEPDFTVEDR